MRSDVSATAGSEDADLIFVDYCFVFWLACVCAMFTVYGRLLHALMRPSVDFNRWSVAAFFVCVCVRVTVRLHWVIASHTHALRSHANRVPGQMTPYEQAQCTDNYTHTHTPIRDLIARVEIKAPCFPVFMCASASALVGWVRRARRHGGRSNGS